MYDMIAVNRPMFQITEHQDINDTVNTNYKSVSVFGNKTLHDVTFLV